MKINLNSYATVTLTDIGICKLHEWYQRQYDSMTDDETRNLFSASAERMIVEPGKIRCQITKLNDIFGNWSEIGRECFLMNVEVEVNEF